MSFKPFDGYLFKVVGQVATRSEGPTYCLQALVEWNDFKKVPVTIINKKSALFEPDKTLESFLHQKVTIEGTMGEAGLDYSSIKPLHHAV